jgi:hypothetical protein
MDSCGTAHRRRFGLMLLAAAAAAPIVLVSSALGSTGAISTTDDAPPFNACVNGTSVNCNLYVDKTDAFLSGLQNLGDGTYFFAVTVPGFAGANDGDPNNLSDGTLGNFTTREFSVTNKVVAFLGSLHLVDGNKIQLAPFDTTTNNGGVYQLTVCPITNGQPDTQNCKNDNFKVKNDATNAAGDLSASKTAIPSFTREFNWTITKSVDACQITLLTPNGCSITSSTKTLNYTVTVTKGTGVDSNWQVNGIITVSNPNLFDVSNVTVTDAIDGGGTCLVDGSASDVVTVPGGPGTLDIPYSCTFTGASTSTLAGNNVATITWPDIGSNHTTADTGNVPFDFGATPPTLIHDSVTLSDVYTTLPSSLPTGFSAVQSSGTAPTGTINTTTPFTYAYLVTVPHDCVELDNTAGFAVTTTDNDLDDSGSAAVKAKVCRTPARTGALTMGYWQNKNGQGTITGQAKSGTCPSGTYLRTFLPFQDLTAGSTCAQVATYVYNVIKAATCSGTTQPCNAMLKAQMLSTALDVYFSTSGLGSVDIDLTSICRMIDGSGGTATCPGTYEDTSSAFTSSCESVSQLLIDAAAQSNLGGSSWYGNVKTMQVLAKDTFDAINNQVAFTC